MRRWVQSATGTVVLAALVGCSGARGSRRLGVEPQLRVGLAVDLPAVRLAGNGATAFGDFGELRPVDGGSIRIVPRGTEVTVDGRAGSSSERISYRPADASDVVLVDGRPYRGTVEVFARRGSLTVVNVVGVEGYLRGVVTAEMGRRPLDERAALEAQAIVSRTYALRFRGRRRADGYDIDATVSDQRYVGVEGEFATGVDAVQRTTGLVVTYRGRLIDAFFHSTCGYSTASPEEAFQMGQRLPYLEPVSDRRPGGGYYNDISPRFRWSVSWTGPELTQVLRRTLPAVLGIDTGVLDEIRDVYVNRRGPSGRVTELRVVMSQGAIPVPGFRVRQVLETPSGRPLNSTAFDVVATTEAERVTRLEITGLGAGHGLGLCQWGAIGRARAGQTANRIIATYYPGARVERWY